MVLAEGGRAFISATYRVQFRPEFGFVDAARIASYLADLGVSHLYASPYLGAAPGSTHGYDVVDPRQLNAELGGASAHAQMCEALGAAGLGQILDVVPNHMAITGRDNAWWWDVLENGPSSVYAAYFDVDWNPEESKLRNIVLLPILGDHYGRVLEAGQLRLKREGGSFAVRYFDHAVPIAPRSLDSLLLAAADRLDEPSPDLESVATALSRLPPSWATDRESVRERHRDKEVLRARLAELCDSAPGIAAVIDAEVAAINDDADRLDQLLERQNYRLAWWRTAGQELDYRRFFDITGLIGIRVEDEQVFEDSHALILDFLHRRVIDGVRIDHIDGLREPKAYLDRLSSTTPRAYVVVEKIVQPGEGLPAGWPVAGTTGYEWLNLVGSLLVDPSGYETVVAGYAAAVGGSPDWPQIAAASRQQVLHQSLATDLNRLVVLLGDVCERHRRYRDYTRPDLILALAETIIGFPVYRTYVAPGIPPAESDIISVNRAVATARDRSSHVDGELLGLLQDLLLLRIPGDSEAELALRFQQLTGSVMAKGVEDTAFYRYFPLTALNEVGGNPVLTPTTPADFHRACEAAHARWPASMLTTSTHDTKRSEDVRARIAVLSELAEEWVTTFGRWSAHNARHRRGDWPDPNTEWLLYQTLVGAWPIDLPRIAGYMEKATREAKVHTSWTDPAPDYDDAVRCFIAAVLADPGFVAEVDGLVVARLRIPGWINSMAQKLVTLTAPGVPDLYQGSEVWDLSLVDPDNRRLVDFNTRRTLLGQVADCDPAVVWSEEAGDGRSKLLVATRALQLRQRRPEWFGPGEAGAYRPLVVEGEASDHLVAFTRGGGATTVVPRLPLGLQRRGGWGDTVVTLPPGSWCNLLADPAARLSGTVLVGRLLAGFPVALLHMADVTDGP